MYDKIRIMKIGDLLYFAPKISFKGLNFDSPDIVEKFHKRIDAYYLAPACSFMDSEQGFPAMVLLVSCMDAIGRYACEPATNRVRYVKWLETALPELFPDNQTATKFYEDVRCGAVHEARIKSGCVFTFEISPAIYVEDGIMAVNPLLLSEHVTVAIDNFCKKVAADENLLAKFQKALKQDFKKDLDNANT